MDEIHIDTKNLIQINNIDNNIDNNIIINEELDNLIKRIEIISQNIFNTLGTGFSEYIYHRALEVELRENSIRYESKKIIPIIYKDINIGYGEADLVIHLKDDKKLIIELKAISNSPREIEIAQVHTYINSLSGSILGIVINFPQPSTKKAKDIIDFQIIHPNNI